MANITQIAKMLNISPSTVSRALKRPDLVSPKTRKKIMALAQELGYLDENDIKEKEKRYIGIIVPDINNYYFSGVINNLQKDAYANDLIPIIASSDEQTSVEKSILKQWSNLNLSGILAIPTHRNYEEILSLTNKTPLVLIDRDLENSPFDCMATNNEYGIELAISHLHERGHKKIVFVSGSHYVNPFLDKLNAIKKHEDIEVIELNAISFEELYLGGFEALNQILSYDISNRPTAILAANTAITSGLLYAMSEKGLKICDDISLISYGDSIWARFYNPAITTIRKSKRQISQLAISCLLDRINGFDGEARRSLINPSLMIRNSVKKI